MAESLRLFVVAGEPSGDRLGAELVKRLRVDHRVTLAGVGGPELEGEGLRSLFPMGDLTVMGLNDVLLRLPLLYWRMRQTADAILAQRPDVAVLIDSQVFCEKVAERVREAGYKGEIVLYVSPSVWAWKPERAPLLRPLYDEVLAVLPFEPAVMKRLGGPLTTYVGHPALEHTRLRPNQPEKGPLLLLPGSRPGELRRHLPLMREIAWALRKHPRITGFVLPTLRSIEGRVVEAISGWNMAVYVTATSSGRTEAFADAIAAVAVTGTVTLELALAGIPMVTTYVADRAQLRRARKYNLRFAALPNILYGSELVPEIIGPRRQPSAVAAEIDALLDGDEALGRQREGFQRIRAGMEKGAPDAPLTDPAERVLAHTGQRLPIST